MSSLLERIIFLKSVTFFADVPEDVIAEVATFLEEQVVKSGNVIIEKDGIDNSLYIIVSGKVRVHDKDLVITTLGSSEFFGEFSLLDPGPRIASVTALQDTRMFRLDQEPFLELIDNHGTIARKIMQVLVRYLRNAHKQMEAFRYRDVQTISG